MLAVLRLGRSRAPGLLARPRLSYVSSHHAADAASIKDFVQTNSIRHRLAGDGKLILKYCPFCHPHKDDPSNLYKLCVFLDSGKCVCLRCQTRSSFGAYKLKVHDITVSGTQSGTYDGSGDQSVTQHGPLNVIGDKLLTEAVGQNPPIRSKSVEEYLTKIRGLSKEVLDHYQIGSTTRVIHSGVDKITHECVVFPMLTREGMDLQVLRLKTRSITEKRIQTMYPPKVHGMGFFGWHTILGSTEEIVLTEGEFDAMAVYQGTGIPSISLPNGANSLPPYLLPCLERFRTIWLWMDDDSVGQDAAAKFSKKLGLRRVRLVHSSENPGIDGPKDANDCLRMGVDMKKLIEQSERVSHDKICTFRDLRGDIARELREGRQCGLQLKTLPQLTNILKGLRLGELTVLTGSTGIGKTTLMSQISVDCSAQGMKTLWGSFEIKNHRLAKMMIAQHHNEEVTAQNFEGLADGFSDSIEMYFMRFFGASHVDAVIDAMEHAVYVFDVQHILLDNLQFMLGSGGPNNRNMSMFEAQDSAVSKFRRFATEHNIHITLAVHPRKENSGVKLGISSVFGSAKVTQEADNVVIVQALDANRKLRTISVDKNRFDGSVGKVPFRFDFPSKRMVELSELEFANLKREAEDEEDPYSTPESGGLGSRFDDSIIVS